MTAYAVSMLQTSYWNILQVWRIANVSDFVPNDSLAVWEARSQVSFSGSHDWSGVREDLSCAVLFEDQW